MESLYFQTCQYDSSEITKSISDKVGAVVNNPIKILPPRVVALWPSLRCTMLRCMNQESKEIHNCGKNEEFDVLMKQTKGGYLDINGGENNIDDDKNCEFCRIDDDEQETTEQDGILFDVDLFSSLLKVVSKADVKLYAKFAYLVNLTYRIPQIQPENLLKYYLLRFVTSSMERKKELKEHLAKIEKTTMNTAEIQEEDKLKESFVDEEEQTDFGKQLNHFTSSAAVFFQSLTKNILPFISTKDDLINNDNLTYNKVPSPLRSTIDTTNAAGDETYYEKQANADELNSLVSSPCEWFICDDDQNRTRLFVIQGSESIASWQTNFFFEPTPFEGLDLQVHRGIYEAALCIYDQLLPDVRAHMKTHGDKATFRFTGHSLGGSLALLINLMLLMRGEVPHSYLLPVIAFGAPYVLCGGDELLKKLGLPKNHYQSIAIHRDIVPRAFSVYLSDNIIDFCKTVNVKFRSHPCLIEQRMLFSPMGELMILQPDENFTPSHHLLPPGIGFYHVTNPAPGNSDVEKLVVSAKKAFLRSPYPTDILSEASAWGPQGTISKNHDMVSYIKAIRSVIRKDLNPTRKNKRDEIRNIYWPGFISNGNSSSVLSAKNT